MFVFRKWFNFIRVIFFSRKFVGFSLFFFLGCAKFCSFIPFCLNLIFSNINLFRWKFWISSIHAIYRFHMTAIQLRTYETHRRYFFFVWCVNSMAKICETPYYFCYKHLIHNCMCMIRHVQCIILPYSLY